MSRRYSYANITATLALVLALTAPVWAAPVKSTAASVASDVKRALTLSKRADKNAKKAAAGGIKALTAAGEAQRTAAQALELGQNVRQGPPGEPGTAGTNGTSGTNGRDGAALKAKWRSIGSQAFSQAAGESVLIMGLVDTSCTTGTATVTVSVGGDTGVVVAKGSTGTEYDNVPVIGGIPAPGVAQTPSLSAATSCGSITAIAIDVIAATD